MAPLILNLGARWGEWSASRPGRFSPGKKVPGTHGQLNGNGIWIQAFLLHKFHNAY